MRRPLSLLVALVLAAVPKKGAAYAGELPETAGRLSKRIVLKVSSSGATGRARLQCADTRVGLSSRFTITTCLRSATARAAR